MNKQYSSQYDQAINKVVKMHEDDLLSLEGSIRSNLTITDKNIAETEQLLEELGYDTKKPMLTNNRSESIKTNPFTKEEWDSIATKAGNRYKGIVSIEELFTKEELSDNHEFMVTLRKQFKDLNTLDKWDYAAVGSIGTIAALMDFFIVTKVNIKDGMVAPGVIKSGVESLWEKILPPDKVALLEAKYKVPFDISTNTSRISQEVLGLYPKTHRFQSLGHDPILGFLFGIKDLLRGELTAIDGNGRLIIQNVSGVKGKSFTESVITEFGHLLSDVNATSRTGMKLSVPAPLTPLLQMIQDGNVAYKGKVYTIGDLSKRMYSDGYNFNHFIGMSIPVVLIHILIRLYITLREMFSENYIVIKQKSDILLFTANVLLCAENVGKLVITKNPFAINYVSWTDTAKYAVKTMKYVLVDYHLEQIDYMQKIIDREIGDAYEAVENTWNKACEGRIVSI